MRALREGKILQRGERGVVGGWMVEGGRSSRPEVSVGGTDLSFGQSRERGISTYHEFAAPGMAPERLMLGCVSGLHDRDMFCGTESSK